MGLKEIVAGALIYVSALVPSYGQSCPSPCGDCDGNGIVNILDALKAAQISVCLYCPITGGEFRACNVEPLSPRDCDVDIVDALRMAQCSVGLPTNMSCPQWTLLSPTGNPSARFEHAMAYDTIRERLVLFGGLATTSPASALDDTWEFDPNTNRWELIPRRPGPYPSSRHDHTMEYSPSRGKVVMYGGRTSPFDCRLDDTWEWDGVNWTNIYPLTPSGILSSNSGPGFRDDHVMNYNPITRSVIMFGGNVDGINCGDSSCGNASTINADTWEYDASGTWRLLTCPPSYCITPCTITCLPATAPCSSSPPPIHSSGLAWDSCNSVNLLVTGGQSPMSPVPIQVWEYDGLAWTDISGSSMPPPAQRNFSLFPLPVDPMCCGSLSGCSGPPGGCVQTEVEVGVMFVGGNDNFPGDCLSESWMWDGLNWSLLPGVSPMVTQSSAILINGLSSGEPDRIILFGGGCPSGIPGNETWEFR